MLTGVLRDSLKFQGARGDGRIANGRDRRQYGAGSGGCARSSGSDLLLMPADPDSAIASMLSVKGAVAFRGPNRRLGVGACSKSTRIGLFERRTVPLVSIAASSARSRSRIPRTISPTVLDVVRAPPDRHATAECPQPCRHRVRRRAEQLCRAADARAAAPAATRSSFFRLWRCRDPPLRLAARLIGERPPSFLR